MQVKEKAPFLYNFGKNLFKIIFTVFYRVRVEGRENIPQTGGVIIAPNHISFFDPPLAGSMMKRPLKFMAKQELFDKPVLGFIIKRTNAFPVRRGVMDIHAMRSAFQILKDGHALLVFPEGRRSKEGVLGEAHSGAGMIACNAQVPLIPTRIENTNKMSRFKKIVIKYGKPLYPPQNFFKDDYVKLSQAALDEISKM